MTHDSPPDIHPRFRELREQSESAGITNVFLSQLVDTFYAKIRDDEILGPVFDAEIDDWPPHLEKMKGFWASITLYDDSYFGQPIQAHQKLLNVDPAHFTRWLALFHENLTEIAPSEKAHALIMSKAENIARTLQLAMFDGSTNSRALPIVAR